MESLKPTNNGLLIIRFNGVMMLVLRGNILDFESLSIN